MNIDPRTLKDLLQLQLLGKMSLLSSGDSAAESDDNSDFADLLNSLLTSQGLDTQTAEPGFAAGASVRTSLKPASFNPSFAYAAAAPQMKAAQSAGELEPIIEAASRNHGVQPSLVKAVIDAESSFNSQAVSRAGAKGLMQLMDGTSQGLGVSNPFDPEQNIQGGTRYLSDLLRKYNGNSGVALAAYNAGPGRIDRLGITSDQELMSKMHLLPGETQGYVSKVLRLQRNYEA
ncbi:lytic transglycosylase domain-containing protein [Paenibacillus doosanensis]|uniref:lytic transglycosylase domain-containing protein n=1 Tax=Paenibacillus doosanensis TaxID=1229154 RepID=UPI00217FE447|nr:lytic transglycosylase domain-containing protein [Paenibacillus doosanensis]MCS7463445.1 lytic transglycosylase domain-containing protein [Paenibacillus doosanensis]